MRPLAPIHVAGVLLRGLSVAAAILTCAAAGTAQAVDQPIAGHKLAIKRTRGGKERLVFVSKDPGALFPAIGGADDPTAGVPGGALVEVFSQNNPGIGILAVPGDVGVPGWKVKDGTRDSFRYRNPAAPRGPSLVKRLALKEGKHARLLAASTGLMGPGPQGAVGIRITVGSQRSCALFEGASVVVDKQRGFAGRNAPASALADCSDASLGAAVPLLYDAGLCEIAEPPDLSVTSGTDLHRVTLAAPNAVCNDGTPAILYVRAADPQGADAAKWIIWLEGGGICLDPEGCGNRWCGVGTTHTAGKMSSRWAPAAIRGFGIFAPSPTGDTNAFAGFNMVVAYYCSSDSWMGTHTIDVEDPSGTYPPYRIAFHGHDIVTAMIAALQAGVTSDDGMVTMPDLDDATQVLFAGTSAGSVGMQQNVDRVGETLLGGNPALDFRAVADAVINPTEPDPPEVTAEEAAAYLGLLVSGAALHQGVPDASCLAFHVADPEQCVLNTHVLQHHLSTPLFAKMDLVDANAAPGLYDSTMSFGLAVQDLMTMLAARPTWAEETAARTVPGVFAPLCEHHVNLESANFYDIQIDSPTDPPLSMHDLLWNWTTGGAPTFLVHAPMTGVTSICP